MHFCIFSFNRGELLENCIRSIETCAPTCDITIIDDNSDDDDTRSVLQSNKEKHEVINTELILDSDKKLGGLYNNMQFALKHLQDKHTVCFLQDDMQLVRKLQNEDFDAIDNYFTRNKRSAFLHPAFLKASNRKRDTTHLRWDPINNAYFRGGSTQSVGVHFSAVCILRTDRLAAVNWSFLDKEKSNDSQAKNLFGEMGLMKNPFLIWLPNVTVYRGKRKTLGITLAERIHNSGFYPVEILTEEENLAFKQRDPMQIPFTEDFLLIKGKKLKKPWYHHPLAGSRVLKALHKAETRLRKMLT